MADSHLDVAVLDGGNDLADLLHALHLIFGVALQGLLIRREGLHLGLQQIDLILPGLFRADGIGGVEVFRGEPDGRLAGGHRHGPVQNGDARVHQLLRPGCIGGQAGVGGVHVQRRVRIAGEEQYGLAPGQLVDQIQQGLHIAALAHHVAGEHHRAVAGAAADGLLHGGLPVAQLSAVEIRQVEDGEVVQIQGEVGDGDVLPCIGNCVGHGQVGGEKPCQQQCRDRQQADEKAPAVMLFFSENVMLTTRHACSSA